MWIEKMTLDLYLFRHAETDYNVHNKFIGGRSSHLPLSARGYEQARVLGERLKREELILDKIYSSPSKRTTQTAEIVCSYLDYSYKDVGFFSDFLELSQGDWEGKLRSEVYTPEVLGEIKNKHWNFKPLNGESQKEVEERVYSWIERNLLAEEADLSVGIFGHGMAMKCFLRKILDSDPRLTYRICINNCSITRLTYFFSGQHQGWSLIKINDDSHISEVGQAHAVFA